MSVLEVRNLSIEYKTDRGPLRASDDVSFDLGKAETLGFVGESGCGKTTLGKAILGLLDDNGSVVEGEILYDGQDLTKLTTKEFRKYRWNDIAYIPQNAMNALDPVYRVGSQIVEAIRANTNASKSEAREKAGDLLESVELDRGRLRDYPHELSGGQRQRVVIALALALSPSVVIADEPTTGLDVVVQDEILQLIKDLQAEFNNSMIFITHDMSVIAEIADRVGVMYGGRLAEIGPTRKVFKQSSHPYTIGLQNAFPSLSEDLDTIISIPGTPPDLIDADSGCRFTDRCPFATDRCAKDPPLTSVSDGHSAKCHYVDRAEEMRSEGKNPGLWEGQQE